MENIYYSMLRQSWRKRHLIKSPPPPKKRPFFLGGGGDFWGIFSWIFGFGTQKKFWEDFEVKAMFWDNYRPIPAILWLCEIQKIWDFQYFWANLATLFFKIQFGAKLDPEPLKMISLTFFRSWRWFISIFLSIFELLKFWVFMHFLCWNLSFSPVLDAACN